MSPTGSATWFNFNKLLQREQQTPLKSTSKSSLLSSAPSSSDDQSMVIESETSTGLDALGAPRIFALVVAIDNYKDPEFSDLTGCRNDGERFISFLTGVLGVPSSQIKFLADEEATRAEILKQFDLFLIHNTSIQRDDAIVFYFAGHGSQIDAPPGWVADGNKIETLCPHDVRIKGDRNRDEVWDIPDRTIGALMRKLAFEKGDNVVAVFDCCHSGGLSRSKTLRVRSIPSPPYPPPADLDREIWSSVPELPGARSAKTVLHSGFQYKAMESHIHLAACRSDEVAFEDPDAPGGLFTTALIECLRRCRVHDTTYSRLFEMLDLKEKGQNPQCEGANTDRLLFSVNTIRDGETTFRVSKNGNKLWVSAGSVHGVVKGTEFDVTSFTRTSVLKAKKVGAFQTVLESSSSITDGRATVSNWNHPTLRVHSPIPFSGSRVIVVPANEPADVALHRVAPGRWMVERFDQFIPRYSGRIVDLGANFEQHVGDVLDAIANFNSCLYRSPGASVGFVGKVKVRLNRIGVIQNESGPVEDDLLDVHQGTGGWKEARIRELDKQYCLTLENRSEADLFPYLFYFDPSDYSVQSWYQPPSPTMAPPLKRINSNGTPSRFAFGYGGFGTNPIEFFLPPGQEVDSGFLKVFLTTAYVDLRGVSQSSITEILSSSRGLTHTLKGAWTCETFVLTCKRS